MEESVSFWDSLTTSVVGYGLNYHTFYSKGQEPYLLLGAGENFGNPAGQPKLRQFAYSQAAKSAGIIGATQGFRSGSINPIANWGAQRAIGR